MPDCKRVRGRNNKFVKTRKKLNLAGKGNSTQWGPLFKEQILLPYRKTLVRQRQKEGNLGSKSPGPAGGG